ncbi:MAG TPA: hypothetical protein VF794_05115 [Archangium sp.]|jgi:hypothetical protein|uniref:hypothetical protein n=1 Tax=Archangium sp. TaxID=1872627 RepID=UPI002ED9C5C8
MRRGDVRRRVLGLLCLPGLVGVGCTPARPAVVTDSVEVERPAPSQEDTSHRDDSLWRLKLRAWMLRPDEAELPPNTRSAFRRKLELADGSLEVLGFEEQAGSGREAMEVSVVLLQPASGGDYVVNAWTSLLPMKVTLSLADSWVSQDRKMALLLVKLAAAQETRWVVLGSDGQRLWLALGTPPEEQFIAPAASFFTYGKDLYLDVKRQYVSRLRLGKDGRFPALD